MSDCACDRFVQISAKKTTVFRYDGDGRLALMDVGGVVMAIAVTFYRKTLD